MALFGWFVNVQNVRYTLPSKPAKALIFKGFQHNQDFRICILC
jgi:hypothetical protein